MGDFIIIIILFLLINEEITPTDLRTLWTARLTWAGRQARHWQPPTKI